MVGWHSGRLVPRKNKVETANYSSASKGPNMYIHKVKPNQTAWMHRLIWVPFECAHIFSGISHVYDMVWKCETIYENMTCKLTYFYKIQKATDNIVAPI